MPDEPLLSLDTRYHDNRDIRDPKVRSEITATVLERLADFSERAEAQEAVRVRELMREPAFDPGVVAELKRDADARAAADAIVPPLLSVAQEQRDALRQLVQVIAPIVPVVQQQAEELSVERDKRKQAEKVERRYRAWLLWLTVALVVLTLLLLFK